MNKEIIDLRTLDESLLNTRIIDLINSYNLQEQKEIITSYSIIILNTDDICIGKTIKKENSYNVQGYLFSKTFILNTYKNYRLPKNKQTYIIYESQIRKIVNIDESEYNTYYKILSKIEKEQNYYKRIFKKIIKKYENETFSKMINYIQPSEDIYLIVYIKSIPEKYLTLTVKELKEELLQDYQEVVKECTKHRLSLSDKINKLFLNENNEIVKINDITDKNIETTKIIWNESFSGFSFYDDKIANLNYKELKQEDEFIFDEMQNIVSNLKVVYNNIYKNYINKD